jgi:hypothetical protein
LEPGPIQILISLFERYFVFSVYGSLTHIPQEPSDPAQSQSQKAKSRWCRVKMLILPLEGLHGKHALQRGIWVLTEHLLWDQGKPRKTLIVLAGLRIFRMETDF